MLWNAAIVLVTAGLVLIGVREGVRRALVNELDGILREDLKEVRLALAAAASADDERLLEHLDRKAAGHEAHRWFVRFFDEKGQTVWVSLNAPEQVAWTDKPRAEPFGTGDYRLVQEELPRPRGDVAAIRVGASTALIGNHVRRIDRLVIVTAGLVLVAAPLCCYWLAGRALKPVGNIIDTASRLRPSRLDERLPDRGTGDELDKLAGTVNRLLDRIAAYLGERRDLLANSAHELRSPLAAIRSTVEVALQSGRLSPDDEEVFSVVIDQCHSLQHLVNQLLLLAETEAERLIDRSETVRLDQLAVSSLDMFSAAAEQKSVDLRISKLEPVIVRGNRNHLRQVVNNLLDNALKFTPANGWITVELEYERNKAVLMVTDSGIGIAREDLPRVFDRFFCSDRSRNKDRRCTGLGLSICHAVITAHNGTIEVQSHQGEGTAVTVKLPAEIVSAVDEHVCVVDAR